MSTINYDLYSTLQISRPAEHVLECALNTPANRNAFTTVFWDELRDFFQRVAGDPDARAILLTAAGRLFTAGLDLQEAGSALQGTHQDVGHQALHFRRIGQMWQDSTSAIERCGKPVVACVHGACIGAGLEMVAAADIRLCAADAFFAMKEVDIGLAADVGGLQRFPKVVGNQSLVRELALTGRKFKADEALALGFVSAVLPDLPSLRAHALDLAQQIAAKSPIATLGVKQVLNFARDHTVDEALDYALTWNSAMTQTSDMATAVMGFMSKQTPKFPNLPAAPQPAFKAKL